MANTFTYRVLDRTGQMVTGELEAESEALVASRLRQMGYVVVDLAEKAGSPNVGQAMSRFGKIKQKDITVFSRQFATMINAGLPLLKSLVILGEQTANPKLGSTINALRQDVESGSTLSIAMARHKKVFSDLYVSMIQAGEIGGVLDEVLNRVSDLLEKEASLKGKVKSAMMYPTVAFSFAMIIVFVMVTFIVPVFADMFKSMEAPLPAPTAALLWASKFMKGNLLFIIAGSVAAVWLLKRWKKTDKGRRKWDAMLLRLPVMGQIIIKAAIARFTRTFGTLVNSGVPILQALDIVGSTSGNVIISEAVVSAKASVREGEALASPLGESGIFPPMVVQMIAIGEETGALDAMLDKIADFYDEEVEQAVDGLTALIEPLMIIVMGSLVGGIIIALYLPIFTMINYIK